MAQMMKDNGAEESSDPKAHQLLQLVENCANPNNVEFDLNRLRIYSGSLHYRFDRMRCARDSTALRDHDRRDVDRGNLEGARLGLSCAVF